MSLLTGECDLGHNPDVLAGDSGQLDTKDYNSWDYTAE